MKVKFEDYSANVNSRMESLARNVLEEAAGELESQIKDNTKVGKVNGGKTRREWQHIIRNTGNVISAEIGNPNETAIWLEYGTGEYALEGNGRSGGWYVLIGEGEGQIPEAVVNAYGFKIHHGKDGKRYIHTFGMRPQRPAHKAYQKLKNKLIGYMQSQFKRGLL